VHEPNVPENTELWKFVQDMNERVSILEHRHSYVSTAFPQNDLGKPDYDGHRKDHLQIKEDSKVVAGYKGEVTKTVIGFIAGGVLSMIVSGFLASIAK
jgi:hypothetical protein